LTEKAKAMVDTENNNLLHWWKPLRETSLGKCWWKRERVHSGSATSPHAGEGFVSDGRNKILVYKLATVELQGRIFGSAWCIECSRVLAVKSDKDQISSMI